LAGKIATWSGINRVVGAAAAAPLTQRAKMMDSKKVRESPRKIESEKSTGALRFTEIN
jgi:hypothetical protein